MTDILDLIDGALRDHGTSTDAMRWTPEPEVDPDAVDCRRFVIAPPAPLTPSAPVLPGHLRVIRGDGTVMYEGDVNLIRDGWQP